MKREMLSRTDEPQDDSRHDGIFGGVELIE